MKILTSVVVLFTTIIASAQIDDVNLPVDSPRVKSESDVVSQIYKHLSIDNSIEVKVKSVSTDELGYTHYRCGFALNQVPIAFIEVSAHVINSELVYLSGNAIRSLQEETALISKKEGLTFAMDYSASKNFIWLKENQEVYRELFNNTDLLNPDFQGNLVYVQNTIIGKEADLHLAYKFDVYTLNPDNRIEYYVSAVDGKLIYTNSLIADLNGIVGTRYSGTKTVQTTQSGSQYILAQSGGPRCEIHAYFAGAEAFDSNNNWGAAENAAWVNPNGLVFDRQPVLDVYWGSEMFYDYFKLKHNWKSFNNANSALRGYYHNDNVDQAFWNGIFTNYYAGNTLYSPLTSLDVVAHEFAHGIASTVGIATISQPGAINESLSDIWAACVEAYADPTKNHWITGEEISLTQYASRSLADPKSLDCPDTYQGTFWKNPNDISEANDYGGVHYNSGVMNHWFYLLTEGGNETNDLGNTFYVNGIGITDAARIVFRAETVYFTSSVTFSQARDFTLKATSDLFGNCSQQYESVLRAWYGVGVGSSLESTNSLVITTDVPSSQMSYEYVFSTITASNKILTNATATYETSEQINLKPGFSAVSGSNFHAEIVPCRSDLGGIHKIYIDSTQSETGSEVQVDEVVLNAYPNPANDKVRLESNKGLINLNYRLSDQIGNVIETGRFSSNRPEFSLSGLQSGVYFITLDFDGENKVVRIIKI